MLELVHPHINNVQAPATSWSRDLMAANQDRIQPSENDEYRSSGGLGQILSRLQSKFAYPPDMALRIESEVQARTHHLYKQAHFDFLTHLPNRARLYEYLNECVMHAQRSQSPFSLVFMDLDGFKLVNDSLGHHAGDELLRLVSARVLNAVKDTDMVARLGGDEFVLVLPGVAKKATLAAVCERLIREVSRPYWIENQAVNTSPSLGVATYGQDGKLASELIDRADQALYYAKEQGKKTYAFFSGLPQLRCQAEKPLQACITQAVEQGDFQLLAQHQVDIKRDQFVGVSLTLNWPDAPDVQALSDLDGLLGNHPDATRVNAWLWDSVCYYLSRWQRQAPDWTVSLPGLASRLASPASVDFLVKRLQSHGISPEQVHLNVGVDGLNDDSHLASLNAFSQAGFQITLSDVGRLALDLTRLGQVSLSEMRLNETWLEQQLKTVEGTRCVRAVIDMAHTLDASVVATGVDDAARAERLRQMGCDMAQGPYWGQPTAVGRFM
ncbi:bifunctional diguanylate cyclase/phosphodiesterase [Thiomicrospira sp. WB1]|uniref:putative bifunctional diguanylate cyclase/phosphodiesterase n=1 Tax=Thiomicrospira sp. WB1 TaxID=1685380 RepID=UPI0007460226|nr:diguanylate cyclase [Thiomicrospira sp. WB1]KUJ72421.1 hypothetical protein AVO41_00975 [Thiomicrospira sp. WB1]